MRKSFLLSGVLLASLFAMRCDGGYKGDDDDGDSGQSGESGKAGKGSVGGTAGKAGATGGKGGAAGSATETGGSSASGTGGDATPGGTGGDVASGGTGGGTGGSGTGGDDAMGGEPGTGGSAVGTGGDGTGGTTGGTGAGMGGASGKGGSAGKGGSSGAGGTSGAAGSAGKGGSAGSGGLTCSTGVGLALTPERGSAGATGWIEGDYNCVGVQGAVLVTKDLSGSTISLDLAELDAGRICVSGQAAQVVGGDFESYWGAAIDVQLNNPDTGYAYPYDASSYGVDGFSFSLSGTIMPVEVRTELLGSASTQYCKRICATGSQSILVSQAHADCWEGDTGATPSATSLVYLRFLIPASETADDTFDFCIDDLAAITNGASVGTPGTCPEPEPTDPLSCVGYCGDYTGSCWCDSLCIDYPTGCCADFDTACAP